MMALYYGRSLREDDDRAMAELTALMYASMKNNPKLIFLLLRNAADRAAKSAAGKDFEDYGKAFDPRSFLQSAGCILSPKDKTDMEAKVLLSEKNYDRFDWGSRIYESTGKVFFRSMTAGDEE